MATRRPLVVIGGVKQELPSADTIAQALIEGLTTDLAGKVAKSGDSMTGPLSIGVNGALSITTAGDDLISLQGIGRIFHFSTSLGANTLAITNLGASTVDLQLDDTGLDVFRPRIRVGSNEVWHAGNLLNIGTTAASARTALGLGTMATETAANYVTLAGAQTISGAKVFTGGWLVNRRVVPRVYLESPDTTKGYIIDSNVSDSVFGSFRILRRDNDAEIFVLNNAGQISAVSTIATTGAITAGGVLTGRTQTRAQNADNSHSVRMEIGGDNSKNLLAAGGVAPFYVGNQFGVTDQPVYLYNNNAVRLTINADGSIVAGARYQTSIAAAGWAYLANFSGTSAGGVWADSSSQVRFVNAAFNAGIDLTASLTTIYGTVKPNSLAGTGTRMVVAAADGTLSTQAIPGGGGGVTSVFTRTGAVVADVADYESFYLRRDGVGSMAGDLDLISSVTGARLRFMTVTASGLDPAEYITVGLSANGIEINDDIAGRVAAFETTGVTFDSLSGSGTRMVVAGAGGQLSTQALPSSGPTWLRQTSSVNNTTPGTATNTDLQFSAAANTRYILKGYCRYTTVAATTGFQPVITGPAGTTVFGKFIKRTATAVGTDSEQAAVVTAISTPVAFGTSVTSDGWIEFWVILETSGTAGTAGLRFQSEISGSSVQLVAGSVMSYAVLP